jgi:hypothetical protein
MELVEQHKKRVMELEQQMVIETEWLDENDVFFATRAIGFLITNKFGVTEELR